MAVLFALWAVISLAQLEFVPWGWRAIDFARQLYGNILLPVAAYLVIAWDTEPRTISRLITSTWVASIGVSMLTVIEHFTGWTLWGDSRWQYVDIGRSVGPLANPAVLGTYLGFVIVSASAYLLWSRENVRRSRLAAVAIAVALPALWFTYTRAPMLAVLVALALLVAPKSEYRFAAAMALVVCLIAVAIFWGSISDSRVVVGRFANTSNAEGRLLLSAWSIELAARRPIAGWGYGGIDAALDYAKGAIATIPVAFARNDTSHNTFLTYLVELGVVGIALYAFAWVPPVVNAARKLSIRTSVDWRRFALLGIIVVFAVNALFIDMRFFSLPVLLGWMGLGGLEALSRQPGAEGRAPGQELPPSQNRHHA
jgi:O-antigen ligase